MKSPNFLTPMVFGVVAIVATPFQSAQALNVTEVGAIAEAVTVRIDGQNPGSGVIVKHQGNVYIVLTAAHVVATEDEYKIVTSDNQLHDLDYSKVKKLPNVDLALVEFTSPKTYKVADMGDSTAVKAGESIYVSGFPVPTVAITQSIWNFSDGRVKANSNRPLADGYALVYSNDTLPGMSGGAVLNSQGKLIAIHGRADAEQTVQRTETVYQKTGFNLGIPINTFLNLAAKVSPTLGFIGKAIETTGTTLTKDDWMLQAADQYRKGNYQEAIQDFDQAIAIDQKYAEAHYNRGVTYSALKQYDLALKDYTQAIQINPEYAEVYNNRGYIYNNALKQYELAIKDFSQAIQINPEYADSYYNRGVAYSALKQYKLALKDYTQAIQINPEFASAYYNRGHIYYFLKQYDLAIKDYTRAIQVNPEYKSAYNNRGETYKALKQYDLAFKDYSRVIQIDPEDTVVYSNRGNTYADLKQYELALKDYSRAIQINSKNGVVYLNRGITYNDMGNKPQAKQDLQTAARLFKQQNKSGLYRKTMNFLENNF